jgi:chlorobactene glucosyltransferase
VHVLDALTLIPSSIPFGLNLVNHLVWPRDTELLDPPWRVSVLIPARDEEATIEACVRAALDVQPPVLEVWVCDDQSTDRTPEILVELQKLDPRLKVLQAAPLPAGWVGKPHACHQLGQVATGDLFLFVDADTNLTTDATQRLAGIMHATNARVISPYPRQDMVTWAEQAVLPLVPLTFTSWFPLDFIWKHVDPKLMIVNGQVIAFRREAYEFIGGFASVKSEIVDDMAIGRRAKQLDQRVCFADGSHIAHTRMYRNADEIWKGFSKNFYAGIGGSPTALLFVVVLYFLAYLFPLVRLTTELWWGVPSLEAAVGVAFIFGARAVLARDLGHSVTSVLLHPVGVIALLTIAMNSMRWFHTDRIQWRGRTYTGRGDQQV